MSNEAEYVEVRRGSVAFREGERQPDWLADGDECRVMTKWGVTSWAPASRWNWITTIPAFRIPSDHWAADAIKRGLRPWPGGEKAPADWDGGGVLLRTGNAGALAPLHPVERWRWHDNPFDIIGYTPKRKAVSSDEARPGLPDTLTPELWARIEAFIERESDKRDTEALALRNALKPVDPLLIEAREIVAKWYEANPKKAGGSRAPNRIRAGESDGPEVEQALAALRRGFEIAQHGLTITEASNVGG